jgi:hypothetical protein
VPVGVDGNVAELENVHNEQSKKDKKRFKQLEFDLWRKTSHPELWSGKTRNWELHQVVHFNLVINRLEIKLAL